MDKRRQYPTCGPTPQRSPLGTDTMPGTSHMVAVEMINNMVACFAQNVLFLSWYISRNGLIHFSLLYNIVLSNLNINDWTLNAHWLFCTYRIDILTTNLHYDMEVKWHDLKCPWRIRDARLQLHILTIHLDTVHKWSEISLASRLFIRTFALVPSQLIVRYPLLRRIHRNTTMLCIFFLASRLMSEISHKAWFAGLMGKT